MHLLIVLVVALVVLGPKRLPGAGRALGHGLREFKDSIGGISPAEEPAQIPAVAAVFAETPAGAAPTVLAHDRTPVAAAAAPTVLAHDRTPVAAGEPA
jgi:sec-independent protein translocase protein TatA